MQIWTFYIATLPVIFHEFSKNLVFATFGIMNALPCDHIYKVLMMDNQTVGPKLTNISILCREILSQFLDMHSNIIVCVPLYFWQHPLPFQYIAAWNDSSR